MEGKFFILCLVVFLLSLTFVSAAHFIVGYVNDAGDGASADGRVVVLWNPANGANDNVSDIVGPAGNSGANNIYLIDCELLNVPCQVGDGLTIDLIRSDNYTSNFVNLTVSGAGFDIAPNMSLNSPPTIASLIVDDNVTFPYGEIDLEPFTTKQVTCEGVIVEYDNENITNVSAEFFDSLSSFYGDLDDNNYHYTNTSCYMNASYGGANETYFNCGFDVEYYANAGTWACSILTYDNQSNHGIVMNTTTVNTLIAISVPDSIDYGYLNGTMVSSEIPFNVTNAGNAMVNLSLSGYGATPGDGNSMNCTSGGGISVGYEKYNLTASNPGDLTLNQFESFYTNLSSNPVIEEFNLDFRTNDTTIYTNEINNTYWRIYLPAGVGGTCSGNIVIGAVQS